MTAFQPVLEAWSPRPCRRPVASWCVTLPCGHSILVQRQGRPSQAVCYLCPVEPPAQMDIEQWLRENPA